MIGLSKEKVLLLHQYIAAETGGSVGVRDKGLLESALQSAFATFGGRELYPSKVEKAARIGASLVANHAFLDGNKRIGMYVMLTFLETNGVRVSCTDDDLVQAALALASGTMSYEGLRDWLLARIPPRFAPTRKFGPATEAPSAP
jgi:death-on-curing protein